MKYLIDLDDTIIYSTDLNNDAYNYALRKYHLKTLEKNGRITREDIKPTLIKSRIILTKQSYFCERWMPYRVIYNTALINKISIQNKNDCYIWTKANKNRAFYIYKMCGLDKYFTDIIFDKKVSFNESIPFLLEKFSDDLIIYENNTEFFHNKSAVKIDQITSNCFNVSGFLIRF